MFALKIELLVLTMLVSFNLEVDSASITSLKEANNTIVDSENPDSAELEYRMLHNKKSRKVLAKLLQKFLEKLNYDSDENNEKQTVFDISKSSTIASLLTTEVMNTRANIIDSTTPIPLTTEQSTEVSNSTFEVTNSDQSHVTEPINTKSVSYSKTTKRPDDVIKPIQNYEDNNYPDETSVTDENKEENNNSSTTIISSEIPTTTPTELTMLSNDFTKDNDNNSTTQSPVTTQTTGLIDNADPENVLDKSSLEKQDNISTTKGPDYSLTENPEIFNITEGINANNESITNTQEFNMSETTQNIGLTDTSLENVTTSNPIPNLQENTNELKNVMPKVSNLTENSAVTNNTVFTPQDSDKPSTSQKEVSAENTDSSEPLNTTKTSEIPEESIEFNDTNTSKIPDNNSTEVINLNNATTNGIHFFPREFEELDPLQNEPKYATSTVPIIITTITPENPNQLRDTRTTMMPVGNSTEDITSSSDELATSQPTGLTESPIPNTLDNNNTRNTKIPTNNSTENTNNIESVTTELPLIGFTNSPISESLGNKSNFVTEEPVFANKINNSNSEHANDTTTISIAENPKEDNNTSVPLKDTNLNSSLAVESNNSSIPKPTDSTSEPPTNADNKPDKSKSENHVKETKSQEHIDQQNNQKEPICDHSTSKPNGTADINNLISSTEESNQLKNNTLLIILLQNPITNPGIPKNSLQRLFMLMMISNS